jgi:hypothetical protein
MGYALQETDRPGISSSSDGEGPSHHRPSLANRYKTKIVTATGNLLGIGLSYRARAPSVSRWEMSA